MAETILFPAQAGVIPMKTKLFTELDSVPRASGGDPSRIAGKMQYHYCSPRKRG